MPPPGLTGVPKALGVLEWKRGGGVHKPDTSGGGVVHGFWGACTAWGGGFYDPEGVLHGRGGGGYTARGEVSASPGAVHPLFGFVFLGGGGGGNG